MTLPTSKQDIKVDQKLASQEGSPNYVPEVELRDEQQMHSRWLPVLGAFFLFIVSWFVVCFTISRTFCLSNRLLRNFPNTYGPLQVYLKTTLLPTYSESKLAWIGSTQAFLLQGFGLVGGPLVDRGHSRILLPLGSILCVLGLMMLSLSRKYYQAFLSLGVCYGLGSGMLYTPVIPIIGALFEPAERPKAYGAIVSGISVGGIIFPVLFERLLVRIGFAWTW